MLRHSNHLLSAVAGSGGFALRRGRLFPTDRDAGGARVTERPESGGGRNVFALGWRSASGCIAFTISTEPHYWFVNLPVTAWDSYSHLTALPTGSERQDGNGKKTCRRGSLRRGISSSRESWGFHISRHAG